MLAKFLRRWIGSVRLSVFLITLGLAIAVIIVDKVNKKDSSQQLYNCIIALAGLAAVFVWKDTERPSGYHAQGYTYKSETEGEQ